MVDSDILFSANNINQLYVLQYSSGEYKKFESLYKELEDYLILLVSKNPESFKTAYGYKNLIKLANDKVDDLILTQELKFTGDFELLAEQQAEFVQQALNKAVVNYSAAIPSLSVLVKDVFRQPMVLANKPVTLDEMSEQITTSTKKNVNDAITLGFVEGRTTDQIITSIRGNKTGVKGAVPQSRLDTERVVRTSLNHVATVARDRANKQNHDIVIGYKILATLDSRTSKVCRNYDGQIFLYSDSFNPKPPFHYFCRTTTQQELHPDSPLRKIRGKRTRASKGAKGGKPVKAELNYYDWLKTQPAKFQDEALGKKEGLIFRNSGLSTDEFKSATVNQFGKPLNIKQMREKNKLIDKYLGED